MSLYGESMNLRQRIHLMWLGAVLLTLCAAGVVAAGLTLPIRVEATSRPSAIGEAATTRPAGDANDSAPAAPTSLASLQQLCQVDLRGPLFDPPPPPPPVNAIASVRLIGTAQEPDHTMAMFQLPGGQMAVCEPGQSFQLSGQTVKVVEVGANRVKVEYAGRVHELTLPVKP